MSRLRECLEILLRGGFICPFSQPDLHQAMLDQDLAVRVKQGLLPLGRVLAYIGDEAAPDTFYAGYASLDSPQDRQSVASELTWLRDQIKPLLDFIRLYSRAEGSDVYLAPGEEVSFSRLIEAIEANTTYAEMLRDLAGHQIFRRISSARDNKDSLGRALEALTDEGFLVRANTQSANFVVTGKMGYVFMALEWVAAYHEIAEPENRHELAAVQGGLEL